MKDTSTQAEQDPTDLGRNRTGIATSPRDSKQTIEGAQASGADVAIDDQVYAAERLSWAREAGPVGSMPPPLTVKGVAKTALQMLKGHQPTVFLDKLGERLAYERTGVRLYEALMVKLEAGEPHAGGPTLPELQRIRDDELQHFAILRDAIVKLGADPTAVTPCADVTAVASLGALQVLSDPRTTLTQCLDVMLMIELGDGASWELLADLAADLGQDDLAQQFRHALLQEERHIGMVRGWVTAAVRGQAGVAETPETRH